MTHSAVEKDYFEWMLRIVYSDNHNRDPSYDRLLTTLHEIEFTWIIPLDFNRAEDGKELRWRYSCVSHEDTYRMLPGPSSVLEMMIALAIRCEETMDDPRYGNRTAQWFWKMVTSLGLGGMTDDRFDREYVEDVIQRFLNREYSADGRGGLFTVKHCRYDMRDIEIWKQMNCFLDCIV